MLRVSCPDENLLVAFATARASDDTRTTVVAHLDACATCRRLVAALARGHKENVNAPAPFQASERSLRVAETLRAPGTVIDDRFRLDRFLGSGATSEVWGATDETGRSYALKFMRGDSAVVKQRMLREARIATRLVHPGIVRVHSVHDGAHGLYLVLDWVAGESLEKTLEGGLLPRRTALHLVADVAEALAFAHANGIVHRDLKPANLMVNKTDNDLLRVTLLDLGVAKPMTSDGTKLTATGASVGTPHYMAPEQLFGETDVDGRADVWALGVLLFGLLTGESPIEGSGVGEVYKAMVLRKKTDLGETVPTLAPELAQLYREMTHFDRSLRLGDLRLASTTLRRHAQ
jgi:serine/threonine-protein kinase